MKIFGHPMSTATRRVLVTAHETNHPHEFILVDFGKGEHKQAPHLGRQPFGQVPSIDDDGFQLYESRAIARYLDAKTGGALTPTGLQDRARMEQWISVEVENFSPHAMKPVYHHVFKREQAADVLETAAQKLDAACTVLDHALGNHAYLVGDQLTLADLSYLPVIEYGMMTPAKDIYAKHANVMAWWHRASDRPAWRKAAGRP